MFLKKYVPNVTNEPQQKKRRHEQRDDDVFITKYIPPINEKSVSANATIMRMHRAADANVPIRVMLRFPDVVYVGQVKCVHNGPDADSCLTLWFEMYAGGVINMRDIPAMIRRRSTWNTILTPINAYIEIGRIVARVQLTSNQIDNINTWHGSLFEDVLPIQMDRKGPGACKFGYLMADPCFSRRLVVIPPFVDTTIPPRSLDCTSQATPLSTNVAGNTYVDALSAYTDDDFTRHIAWKQ